MTVAVKRTYEYLICLVGNNENDYHLSKYMNTEIYCTILKYIIK